MISSPDTREHEKTETLKDRIISQGLKHKASQAAKNGKHNGLLTSELVGKYRHPHTRHGPSEGVRGSEKTSICFVIIHQGCAVGCINQKAYSCHVHRYVIVSTFHRAVFLHLHSDRIIRKDRNRERKPEHVNDSRKQDDVEAFVYFSELHIWHEQEETERASERASEIGWTEKSAACPSSLSLQRSEGVIRLVGGREARVPPTSTDM